MNILILGSGGREHAFAWKLSQSEQCSKLFIAPGNAGTSAYGENINIKPTDFEAVKSFCIESIIDMVVVGPEDPLVKGISDYFLQDKELNKITVIGPGKEGAQLEGSKDFSKEFMQKYNIPTAGYKTFNRQSIEEGFDRIRESSLPIVLKADGLAAGKGVVICSSHEEAEKELKNMILDEKFGNASSKVVIEEFLDGIELSVFVLTDGVSYKILPSAKDYKRIGEQDTGLNTGGMGAISPVPFADNNFMQKVEERIIKPTILGLKKENITYKGFLFIGLMNVKGEPYVIEYNVRMGDPETEVVIPRIKSDLVELFSACGKQELDTVNFETDERIAVTIMMVSGGYPGDYEKGKVIKGLQSSLNDTIIFHAGTKHDGEKVVTNGGRVLAITSLSTDMEDALNKSYKVIKEIDFEGKYYRKDIGQDLLKLSITNE